MKTFISTVFRFFFTGIAALLPLAVTVFIVSWVVRLADAYIGPSSTFGRFLVTASGGGERYISYIAGYLVVILLTVLLGFLVTRATVARIHDAIDAIFEGIPLFGKIYKAVGQVVALFSGQEKQGLDRFGGAVEIDFGNARMFALLTSSEKYAMADGRPHYLVFVPSAPIPATGFTLLVPEEHVHPLDLPVEDLAKILMSLGILAPQVMGKPHPTLNRIDQND
jgi:uncharacterized membrane protein